MPGRPRSILPRYYQLKETIKKDIVISGTKINDPIPSDRELACRHNVAHKTVRRAIEELINEGILRRKFNTRARVAQIPVLNTWNRPPVPRRTGKVIIASGKDIISEPQSLFTNICGILADNLEDRLWRTSVWITHRRREALPAGDIRRRLDSEPADGILAVGMYSEQTAENIIETGLPAVFIDYAPKTVQADGVVTNNPAIATRLMRHLQSLGHKKVDYILSTGRETGEADPDEMEQSLFWRQWKENTGGKGKLRRTSFDEEDIKRTTTEILAEPNRPTALYCGNYEIAEKLRSELVRRGVRVPEDLSMVTVGGFFVQREIHVSSIYIDWVEICRVAVQRLEDLIAGVARPGGKFAHCDRFVDRGSTAQATNTN